MSAIFDGTTRLGEAFAVVLCFISEGKIVQRLVKLQMLAMAMNTNELAHEIISVSKLCVKLAQISFWHAYMIEHLLMVLP